MIVCLSLLSSQADITLVRIFDKRSVRKMERCFFSVWQMSMVITLMFSGIQVRSAAPMIYYKLYICISIKHSKV